MHLVVSKKRFQMLKIRRLISALLPLVALSVPSYAESIEEASNEKRDRLQDIRAYRQLGEMRFKKFIFHIYDAELRVAGSDFTWDHPFALTLTYARKISEEDLVEASLSEIARIEDKQIDAVEYLRTPLAECFADVREGDQITGHSLNINKAEFYFNGQQTCTLEAPGASKAFFSIWLGDKTMDPDRSRELLGMAD